MQKILVAWMLIPFWALASNQLSNSSFEFGTDMADCLAWNRMADLSYLCDIESGWCIDQENSFHGARSLRGNGESALTIHAEATTKGVFSAYLKAAEEGFRVRVEVHAYHFRTPVLLASQEVSLAKEWTRTIVSAEADNRVRMATGPLFFKIIPLQKGVLWIDALQWEKYKHTAYAPKTSQNSTATVHAQSLKQYPDTSPSRGLIKPGLLPQKYTFRVYNDIDASAVPVTVSLPFAVGAWHGEGEIEVKDNSGATYETQSETLAIWPQDGSIRMQSLMFEADLQAGINTFSAKGIEKAGLHQSLLRISEDGTYRVQTGTTEFVLDPESGIIWDQAEIVAESETGEIYSSAASPEIVTVVEMNGPIHTSVLKRGLLVNTNGKSLMHFSIRMHFWKNGNGVGIEITLANPDADNPMILKNAYLRITSEVGEDAEYFQYFDPETEKFALDTSPPYGYVETAHGILLAPEASARHPTLLQSSANGVLRAFIWPNRPVMSLILSRAMSITREFFYSPETREDQKERYGTPVTALANPEHFTKTDFFVVPTGALNKEKYPFVSAKLATLSGGKNSLEYIWDNNLHGCFDYGDIPGDGGWSNMETSADSASLLFATLSDNIKMLQSGLIKAQHYRDVDTVNGRNIYHCSNHSSGSVSFSHSWPQGIFLHYLFTGSRRSLEVARQVGRYYLSIPEESKAIAGNRNFSRYLLGLADLYAMDANPAFSQRFREQLSFAEKTYLPENKGDKTIFPWSGRLDPYQVWYGACAMMQMYRLTNDATLLQSFEREMQASLNMHFYRLDLQETWPGVTPEEGWAIQLGFHSRHRGALFYPLMKFYSEITENAHYLNLARQAVYADYLSGNRSFHMMDVHRLSVLDDAATNIDEKQLLDEARQLVLKAAAPSLLNGDFSYSEDWFSFWHVPALRQMGYDNMLKSWPLSVEKNFSDLNARWRQQWSSTNAQISPWRYYSRLYAALDHNSFGQAPPSLRLQVTNRWTLGRNATLETVKMRLTPGEWRLSGSYSPDAGIAPKSFGRMQFVNENGEVEWYSFELKAPPDQSDFKKYQWIQFGRDLSRPISLDIEPEEMASWRHFDITFISKANELCSFFIYIYLLENLDDVTTQNDGFINIDDFALEKIQ